MSTAERAERLPLRLRAKRLNVALVRRGRGVLGLNRTVYVEQRLDEYRGYWEGAARLLGARFVPLSRDIWEVRLDGRSTRICGHVVAADDPVTLRVAGDKPLCHALARGVGVPVPEHLVFRLATVERARARVAADPGPWVVKPARGSASGMGITTGIERPDEVEDAAVLASLFGADLLLERMVPGESCRLLFLDGALLHAVRRRGARLVGDGASPLRALARRAGLAATFADPATHATLAAQGLRLDDVAAAGRPVLLSGIPAGRDTARELRTVYDEDVSDRVHAGTARRLAAAVRALGSRFAGVDLVTLDPSRPLEETGAAVLEVNTTPGIHHHYQSEADHRAHPVAVAVLRSLLGARRGSHLPTHEMETA